MSELVQVNPNKNVPKNWSRCNGHTRVGSVHAVPCGNSGSTTVLASFTNRTRFRSEHSNSNDTTASLRNIKLTTPRKVHTHPQQGHAHSPHNTPRPHQDDTPPRHNITATTPRHTTQRRNERSSEDTNTDSQQPANPRTRGLCGILHSPLTTVIPTVTPTVTPSGTPTCPGICTWITDANSSCDERCGAIAVHASRT